MPNLRKIELDVLKPHLPNVLELATAIAALEASYRVDLDVVEMDEKTETLTLVIEGEDLDYPRIEDAIRSMVVRYTASTSAQSSATPPARPNPPRRMPLPDELKRALAIARPGLIAAATSLPTVSMAP